MCIKTLAYYYAKELFCTINEHFKVNNLHVLKRSKLDGQVSWWPLALL